MAQRRFHYEQAFEHYLRANRVPYVAVDEAKKALVPDDSLSADGAAKPHIAGGAKSSRGTSSGGGGTSSGGGSIKSFDFVVYAPHRERNLLVDIKGRMFGSKASASSMSNRRLESWVTLEDVSGLERWQEIFGDGFQATFVFAYCLAQQPPDALFEELFSYGSRWYALREVSLEAYRAEMVSRSRKWGTVHVPREAFDRISRPFSLRRSRLDRPKPGRERCCDRPQVVLC